MVPPLLCYSSITALTSLILADLPLLPDAGEVAGEVAEGVPMTPEAILGIGMVIVAVVLIAGRLRAPKEAPAGKESADAGKKKSA